VLPVARHDELELAAVRLVALGGELELDVHRGEEAVVRELPEVEAELELEALDLVLAAVFLLADLEAGLEREPVRDPVLVLELLDDVVVARVPEGPRLDLALALVGQEPVAAEGVLALVGARDRREHGQGSGHG